MLLWPEHYISWLVKLISNQTSYYSLNKRASHTVLWQKVASNFNAIVGCLEQLVERYDLMLPKMWILWRQDARDTTSVYVDWPPSWHAQRSLATHRHVWFNPIGTTQNTIKLQYTTYNMYFTWQIAFHTLTNLFGFCFTQVIEHKFTIRASI